MGSDIGRNLFNAISTHRDYDVYYLLNLDSTLSYVTPYVAIYFCFGPKYILDHFFVSTLVGKSIVVRKFYRGYVLTIYDRETLVDLIELEMLNFNVILAMDWLYSCYMSLDY